MVINTIFLRTAFSIEHLRWLLLCLFEKEEEESVEQGCEEKYFKWKKKMKTFHLILPASCGAC